MSSKTCMSDVSWYMCVVVCSAGTYIARRCLIFSCGLVELIELPTPIEVSGTWRMPCH